MIQRGQKSGFPLESRERGRIVRQLRRQRLDRDLPAQARVGRAVDVAHSSGSQRINDFVGTDPSTGCDVQCRNYTTAAARWLTRPARRYSVSLFKISSPVAGASIFGIAPFETNDSPFFTAMKTEIARSRGGSPTALLEATLTVFASFSMVSTL